LGGRTRVVVLIDCRHPLHADRRTDLTQLLVAVGYLTNPQVHRHSRHTIVLGVFREPQRFKRGVDLTYDSTHVQQNGWLCAHYQHRKSGAAVLRIHILIHLRFNSERPVDSSGIRRPPNNWVSLFGGSACSGSGSQSILLPRVLPGPTDLNWRNPQVEQPCWKRALSVGRGVAVSGWMRLRPCFEDAQLRNEPQQPGVNAQGDPS